MLAERWGVRGIVDVSAKHVFSRIGLGLMVTAAPLVAAAQSTGGEDPIDLFAKLMPVFTHDRCTGCHGRVNPSLEFDHDHDGGYIPPVVHPAISAIRRISVGKWYPS